MLPCSALYRALSELGPELCRILFMVPGSNYAASCTAAGLADEAVKKEAVKGALFSTGSIIHHPFQLCKLFLPIPWMYLGVPFGFEKCTLTDAQDSRLFIEKKQSVLLPVHAHTRYSKILRLRKVNAPGITCRQPGTHDSFLVLHRQKPDICKNIRMLENAHGFC